MSGAFDHNAITREFIQKVGRADHVGELMTVAESCILGVMALLVKAHGMQPPHAVEMVEHAVQHATERLTKLPAKGSGR